MSTVNLFKGWFKFSTRDLVVISILVALGGVFQVFWAHLVYQAQFLGPFNPFFAQLGFNIWSFAAIYLIRKPGASTISKGLAALIELLLGSPVGPVVIFYGLAEGFGADLAYVLFKRRFTLNMVIVGSLLAHFITLPVDMNIDKIPFQLNAVLAYTGPSVIGKTWISWLIWLSLNLINKNNALQDFLALNKKK